MDLTQDLKEEDISHEMPSTSRGLSTTKERIPWNPLLNIHSSTTTTLDELYTLQLNPEEVNSFSSFKNVIKDNLKKQLPAQSIYINPAYLEETCLNMASKNGLTEFVKFLLDHGANPNKISVAQNRAPIHFATEGEHVNTLTVLLMHSRINPNLQVEGRTALHIAVEKNNLDCVRLLIDRGASANIPNSTDMTVLQLAAIQNKRDIVELILQKCQQSPNLEYKGSSEKTIREVIQETMPELSLPPPISEGERRILLQDLKYYLNVNDEENFLKNIILVQTSSSEFSCEVAEDLLKIAAERDLQEAVKAFGQKFSDFIFRIEHGIWEAALLALHQGYFNTFRELLNIDDRSLKPEMANDLILKACMELEGRVTNGSISNHLECLKLILKKGVNVRFTDDHGNTPLHHAARAGCQEAITLLLTHGSSIGHMNKFNEPPIAKIPADTLSECFDKCVQMKENIEFNYHCLMPHKIDEHKIGTSEMEAFIYIARNEEFKHLLTHPLLSSFLYIKWYRIRYFFYANFIFYFNFYLLLNSYILCMTYGTGEENGTQIDNGTYYTVSYVVCSVKPVQDTLLGIFILMLSLFIFREILQLILCSWHYLTNLRNWSQIVLITLIIVVLCNTRIEIGTMVILLSTWELVTLIGHHPSMSTSIEMFRTVSINFMRFLSPYLLLIFAFALIFYSLFKKEKDTHFFDPFCSFFLTIIMLTGEFNASNIQFLLYPIWSRIVFVLFIFLIAIVLPNLLNGLAVSNITEILSTAELVGLISRLHLIVYFQNIIGNILKFKFLGCKPFKYLIERMSLFADYKKCMNDNNDYDGDNGIVLFKSNSNETYMHLKYGILDSNIIKNVKQITSNKNQILNNKKIMNMLIELQNELTEIESYFE